MAFLCSIHSITPLSRFKYCSPIYLTRIFMSREFGLFLRRSITCAKWLLLLRSESEAPVSCNLCSAQFVEPGLIKHNLRGIYHIAQCIT